MAWCKPSAGVSVTRSVCSIDQQISGADNNLYQAKRAGRNRIVLIPVNINRCPYVWGRLQKSAGHINDAA